MSTSMQNRYSIIVETLACEYDIVSEVVAKRITI